ncbi:putative transcriptional regulator, MerR family [Alkaliphilus metalliredigens QYMF]|uniref:Putative transcriptional regulator, MerR family n=1 Tax=Alkaliphilus metalliredigens (strain QYMF) TaxID=293826 RepID=A6TWC7_ALKMQ|nr:MerR family transcriptional regulator [Alkaliphilus metalliredigens]ABR50495.1 putative transcriptional regulator, MerR family [Alkaliphilus metalliredigens QYMF]
MKEKFLIGELSKIFNISSDTLRHYDRIGLLKPDYDQVNGYRYYSVEKFFALSRILFLKSLDISLEDIKQYFNNQNTDHLLALLKSEEAQIDHKINRLINLKGKIKSKIELIEGADKYINQIRVERLPERWGVFMDIKDIEDAYEVKRSFKEHEAHLKISSWLTEGQIYTSITKEDILGRRFHRFNYFIEISSREENVSTQVKVLPEYEYACLVFCGSYNKIEAYYSMLIQWIEENNYEIAGDAIEKNIVDYGFSDSEEEYISEIQIPIKLNRV